MIPIIIGSGGRKLSASLPAGRQGNRQILLLKTVGGKAMTTEIDIKKDLSFLTGLSSLTWLRYPRTRGFAKHHVTKVTIFVELAK